MKRPGATARFRELLSEIERVEQHPHAIAKAMLAWLVRVAPHFERAPLERSKLMAYVDLPVDELPAARTPAELRADLLAWRRHAAEGRVTWDALAELFGALLFDLLTAESEAPCTRCEDGPVRVLVDASTRLPLLECPIGHGEWPLGEPGAPTKITLPTAAELRLWGYGSDATEPP